MHRSTRFRLSWLCGILLCSFPLVLLPSAGTAWAQDAVDLGAQPLEPTEVGGDKPAPDEANADEANADGANADGANADEGDVATKPVPSLGKLILQSGWIGVPFYIFLGLLSVLATTVALERLLRLNSRRVMPAELVRRLKELIGRNETDPGQYRSLCESWPSPTAAVLRAGVLRAGRPLLEIEKAMEDAMAKEMSAMRSRHRPLTVVGSIAPLVGLLGTVVGMIFAFYQSSQAGLGKAEVLAEYIYLALITTALGLVVAIPSLLFAAWFNAKVERYVREIDDCLVDMLPVFTAMEARTGPVSLASPGGSNGSSASLGETKLPERPHYQAAK